MRGHTACAPAETYGKGKTGENVGERKGVREYS